MGRPAPRSPALKLYLALNAAAFLGAAALIARLAGPGGYSAPRLLLAGTAVLLALATAALAILLHRQPSLEKRLTPLVLTSGRRLRLVVAAVFIVFWCLVWFPPQYTGDAYYYFIALYPLILCGLLASGSALVMIAITAAPSPLSRKTLPAYWRAHRHTLIVMLISLAVFGLIALVTRYWSILQNNEPYWRGAGVPLLSWQVLVAILIVIIGIPLARRLPPMRFNVDLALFFLIWAIAGLLWSHQPIGESYWVTGPRAPNHEYYPFSDLETFDLGSQFALIGQGIFNRQFWDRALYMSFLVYLHAVGGQNYQQLMSIQAALFAVFPAILYLLGKRLHGRRAGILIAGLTILRGLNSLEAAPLIHSSTFKHMLTDFPTAIGLAICAVLLLKWLDAPDRQRAAVLWSGGVLGLTSLLRPHVVTIVVAVAALCLLVERKRPGRGLLMSALTLLAFVVGIAPWMLMGSGGASLISFYGRRIQDVLVQRYPQFAEGPLGAATPIAATAAPVPPESSGPDEPLQPGEPAAPAPTAVTPYAASMPLATSSGLPFPVARYVHNLITSALVLPNSPQLLSLKDTLRHGEGFWGLRWDGSMSPVAAGMLIVDLSLLGLGLGAASRRLGWRGFVPLGIFLIYHGANSLARTSGGRYLVPVDWILVCYYAVGLAEALRLASDLGHWQPVSKRTQAAQPAARTSAEAPRWLPRTLTVLPAVFLIGCLVPLAGVLYPLRYPALPTSALAAQVTPQIGSLGITQADVQAFLAEPGAMILNGRVLYPRHYKRGVGEEFSSPPFLARSYPRTIFDLIGPHGNTYVILPGASPATLPNASDAIVLGCDTIEQGTRVIRALVVVLPQQSVILSRDPAAPLSCPVPEPQCDNNGNCY